MPPAVTIIVAPTTVRVRIPLRPSRARDRSGRDSRCSTAIIADRDASGASYDCARAIDHDIAGHEETGEFGRNAGERFSSGDITRDADATRSASGIDDIDASPITTRHGPARAVDGDSTVYTIGGRIYPATAVVTIADCACVSDVDIAAGATSCIGADAVLQTADCSDSLYRDVAV